MVCGDIREGVVTDIKDQLLTILLRRLRRLLSETGNHNQPNSPADDYMMLG